MLDETTISPLSIQRLKLIFLNISYNLQQLFCGPGFKDSNAYVHINNIDTYLNVNRLLYKRPRDSSTKRLIRITQWMYVY